jgi:hypothetical protein
MSNILVLIAVRNKIKIYDLFNNLMFEYSIDQNDLIQKVITFHSNEGKKKT